MRTDPEQAPLSARQPTPGPRDNRAEAGLATSADMLTLDLRGAVRALRRQRLLVGATMVTALVAAGVVTATQDRTYRASAILSLEPPGDRNDLERVLFGAKDIDAHARAAGSFELTRRALADAGLPADERTTEDFQEENLEIETVPNSTVMEISAEAPTPQQAAGVAQRLAENYLVSLQLEADARIRRANAELQTLETTTRAELRSVQEQLRNNPGVTRESLEEFRDELYARLRSVATREAELQTSKTFRGGGEIVQPARPPRSPSSPRPALNMTLGLLLGAALGAAFALLREQLR